MEYLFVLLILKVDILHILKTENVLYYIKHILIEYSFYFFLYERKLLNLIHTLYFQTCYTLDRITSIKDHFIHRAKCFVLEKFLLTKIHIL